MIRTLKDALLELKSWHEIDLCTHISLKHRYIFFQNSKAASSTIKYHLQKLELEGTGRKLIDVNNRYVSPHVWPTQLSEYDFLCILRDPEFKKIAFVRNPFSRLLSCYIHRIVNSPDSASNKVLKSCNSGVGGADISFTRFIEIICAQPSREQESHWRVQSDEILHDLVDSWSFIGKVERLEEDLKVMLRIARGSDVRSESLDASMNQSPMITGADRKLSQFYNEHTTRLVLERYRRDFEIFGYSTRLFE